MVGRYSLNFGAMCNSSTVWCWRGAGDMNPYLKEGHSLQWGRSGGALAPAPLEAESLSSPHAADPGWFSWIHL